MIVFLGIDLGLKHDEGGQIVVHAAQPIREPRAEARFAGVHVAGIHQHDCRLVIDGVRVGGFDDREVVDHARRVRQQVAHPRSGLSIALKGPMRGRDGEMRLSRGHAGQLLVAAHGVRHVLVVRASEIRLVVEQIDLRRAARHEQIDRPFRLRSKVRQLQLLAASKAGTACCPLRLGRHADALSPKRLASAAHPSTFPERPRKRRRVSTPSPFLLQARGDGKIHHVSRFARSPYKADVAS